MKLLSDTPLLPPGEGRARSAPATAKTPKVLDIADSQSALEPPCAACGHSWSAHHQAVQHPAWPFKDSGEACLVPFNLHACVVLATVLPIFTHTGEKHDLALHGLPQGRVPSENWEASLHPSGAFAHVSMRYTPNSQVSPLPPTIVKVLAPRVDTEYLPEYVAVYCPCPQYVAALPPQETSDAPQVE